MFRNFFTPAAMAACLISVFLTGKVQGQSLQLGDPNAPVRFSPGQNGELHMQGTIQGSGSASTLQRLQNAMRQNPGIRTLVMHIVPGAVDDDAALTLYRYVRSSGLNTRLVADGMIASGGVDLFCAGVERHVEDGGKLLVHPWEDTQLGRGDRVPLANPIHERYRSFYREMGIREDFYEFTLFAPRTTVRVGNNLIPDMHEISPASLREYNVVTQKKTVPGPVPGDPAPAPGTIRSLNDIVGQYTFQYQQQPVTVELNADSTFRYQAGSFSASGSMSLVRNELTLFTPGFGQLKFLLNGVSQTHLRLGDGSVWTRVSSKPGPELSLDGSWKEVRRDGEVKFITISGNEYSETFQRRTTKGIVSIQEDTLTLTDGFGSESFLFEIVNGGQRVNFMDPQTERRISRFHWERM